MSITPTMPIKPIQPIPLTFETRDELVRVCLDWLAYFSADGNLTDAVFVNGARVKVSAAMATVESLIAARFPDPADNPYLRVGRSLIVNSALILKIDVLKRQLILTDFHHPEVFTLNISREAAKTLKARFSHP